MIKDVQASGCPSVQELRTAARCACNPSLPSVDGLATMAAASVVYADAVAGIGAWGDGRRVPRRSVGTRSSTG